MALAAEPNASSALARSPGVGNESGYVPSQLLAVLPVQYASDAGILYLLGNVSAPSLTSITCIGVTASPGADELFAYDMLSILKANYTSVLNTDASLSKCSSIFLRADINDSAWGELLARARLHVCLPRRDRVLQDEQRRGQLDQPLHAGGPGLRAGPCDHHRADQPERLLDHR
jgi:hypothetical protein